MVPSQTERLRDRLVERYEAHDFPAASLLCDELLVSDDAQGEIHYIRGLIFHQTKRFSEAMAALKRATELEPKQLLYFWALAEAARAGSEWEVAEKAYHQALILDPHHFDINLNLATLLHRVNKMEDALVAFLRCSEIDPTNPLVYSNLGAAWQSLHQFEKSEAAYRKAIELNPKLYQAWNNLGNLLHQIGRKEEAEVNYRQALVIHPRYVEAIANLGDLLQVNGKLSEALELYDQARANGDCSPELLYNEGNAYLQQDRLLEAIERYEGAVKLNPSLPQPYSNLGVAYLSTGNPRKAMQCYQKAISLSPDFVDAHWNRSLLWLITGNYEQGWPEHEWRWRLKKYMRRQFQQPLWNGEEFRGKRILLFAEQGLGDTIQFIRYAPMVKALGGSVIIETQPPLAALLRSCPGIDEVVIQNDPLPEFDWQVPLICMPRIFQTKVETVPQSVPYLRIPEGFVPPVLPPLPEGKKKIAICWAGSPTHDNDRNRSCPIEALAPLFEDSRFTWVSFQKGPAVEKLKTFPAAKSVVNWGDHFRDFVDTAWATQQVDLILAVDTSVVHLAGALGRPTWLMIPFNPDWRWMLERSDTPWYPTMQIFRQSKPQDWPGLISTIHATLSAEG